jgi:ABC-2 type transport system permease protein
MVATVAIAQRDFKGFFGTPVGWIAACIIFLIAGLLFFIVTGNLLARGQSVDPIAEILGSLVGFLNYINIFIVPIFTMRVMSDELNQGTYRLQATAPISTWEIVLGKFFGIICYFGVIGLLMLLYPLYVFMFSEPDLKVLFAGWLGMILNIAAIAAIGLFVGSLTKNTVISYLGPVFLIIALLFSAFISGAPEWYTKSVNLLELGTEFTRGIIKTSSLAIYAALIGMFLFLSRLVLESKRWRV